MDNVVEKPSSMVMSVNRNQGVGKEHYKGKKCDYCHFLVTQRIIATSWLAIQVTRNKGRNQVMEMGMETWEMVQAQVNSMEDKVQEIMVDMEEDISK